MIVHDTISDTKRRLRNTRIALVALALFVVVDFFGSLALYVDYGKQEDTLNLQAEHIDWLYNELEANKIELDKYHATEEYIKSLGATEDQAKKIIKASEAMNVSPKF